MLSKTRPLTPSLTSAVNTEEDTIAKHDPRKEGVKQMNVLTTGRCEQSMLLKAWAFDVISWVFELILNRRRGINRQLYNSSMNFRFA